MNHLRLLISPVRIIRTSQTLIRMSSTSSSNTNSPFTQDEVQRYSRQLLMPEIGTEGQLKLRSTSVLIVGCGGLGCPSGLYLAAAGIGKLAFIDNDVVEKSNLHRQVLHRESTIGMQKTQSAMESLKALNSNVNIETINARLNRENALEMIGKYDIIIDATDNAMTRYLLSDACVINKKPLVSGSALRFDGQLTVYNYDDKTPCYRCLFPSPPPPGTVTNCSDGGVIGVVPGIIGSIQALETIKIAIGIRPAYAGQLLLFDGMQGTFKSIKIREKKADCISCGDNPSIGRELMDYEEFCGVTCGASSGLKILEPEERVSCQEYKSQIMDSNVEHLLIDVRPKLQADITKLPHAISIPLDQLVKGSGVVMIEDMIENARKNNDSVKVFMMCRRGNASQRAVKILKDTYKADEKIQIKDIIGGLEEWAKSVDPKFPMY